MVPDSALPLIRAQRTHLKGTDAEIAAAYALDLADDLDQLSLFLPTRIDAWLEIGCGVGGLSALLYKRQRRKPRTLALLDGTDDGRVQAGFHPAEGLRAWNDRAVTEALMAANGIPPRKIQWADIGQSDWQHGAVDLIVSLLSWGHHYPVNTYEPIVRAALRPGGVLILDVRKGTGGEEQLDAMNLELVADLALRGINARKSRRQIWGAPGYGD